MIENLRQYAHAFRNGDTNRQYQGIVAISDHLEALYRYIGKLPPSLVDGVGQNAPAPVPPAAEFAVQGVDGKFLVAIVNPQDILPASVAIQYAQATGGLNRGLTPILHELQSALDVKFDQNSGLTDYGASPQLAYEFQDPNVTKFFRLRSSFDGKNWNNWQIYSSPLTCGPVGVASGLLRTQALVNLNTGNTPSVQPLTQHLATTQIDVASTVNTFGSGANVTYNSGSVDPGSVGTWYVYLLDPTRSGGTVTYIATATVQDITNNDALVYLGKITTVGGGGGAGSGGGSGPCCIAEVEVDMLDGTVKAHKDLRRGDVLKAIDGGPETILRIDLIANVPCFRFRTQGGLVLRGCSSSHLLQWDGGGFEPSSQIHESNRVDTKNGPQAVTQKDFIGHRTVYKLTLDRTKTYFADGFVSHNLILKP